MLEGTIETTKLKGFSGSTNWKNTVLYSLRHRRGSGYKPRRRDIAAASFSLSPAQCAAVCRQLEVVCANI